MKSSVHHQLLRKQLQRRQEKVEEELVQALVEQHESDIHVMAEAGLVSATFYTPSVNNN